MIVPSISLNGSERINLAPTEFLVTESLNPSNKKNRMDDQIGKWSMWGNTAIHTPADSQSISGVWADCHLRANIFSIQCELTQTVLLVRLAMIDVELDPGQDQSITQTGKFCLQNPQGQL